VARVKISVIVPSYQQGRYLDEMIRSAVTQKGPELELIVIDGGSTDETLDVIARHPLAYWISEPDGGQADAINKGLRRATGDVVTWFGADDVYADGIFAAVEEAWQRNPHAIYAAPVANFYARGRQTLLRPHGLSLANVIQYWQGRSLWHDPGLFWSRAAIEVSGELDASLPYSFDYDYLIRALQHCEVVYVDRIAAGFRLHRDSKTVSQSERMMAETAAVSRRYWALLPAVDREGFERAEHATLVRRGASRLVRGRREGLALLRRAFRERPLAALARLALVVPAVVVERVRRWMPARYF
jgi:glycosyltransferase involved in cell wall biosynthesis